MVDIAVLLEVIGLMTGSSTFKITRTYKYIQ